MRSPGRFLPLHPWRPCSLAVSTPTAKPVGGFAFRLLCPSAALVIGGSGAFSPLARARRFGPGPGSDRGRFPGVANIATPGKTAPGAGQAPSPPPRRPKAPILPKSHPLSPRHRGVAPRTGLSQRRGVTLPLGRRAPERHPKPGQGLSGSAVFGRVAIIAMPCLRALVRKVVLLHFNSLVPILAARIDPMSVLVCREDFEKCVSGCCA